MTDRQVVVITGGSAGAGRAAARPVARSQGAHGIFDDMAKGRSLQSQLSMHRKVVAGAVSGAGLALLTIRRRR